MELSIWVSVFMDLSNLFRIQERCRKERNLTLERLEKMETIKSNQNYHGTVRKNKIYSSVTKRP